MDDIIMNFINRLKGLPWYKYRMGDMSQWIYFADSFKIHGSILFALSIIFYIIGLLSKSKVYKVLSKSCLIRCYCRKF